jgi:two-component sensor histidine kinase/ABC-type amino acid transport substrate-binding protein
MALDGMMGNFGRTKGAGLYLILLIAVGLRAGPRPVPLRDNDLRVGLHEIPPLAFIDQQGRARGFIIEVLEEIGAREGWEIRYVQGSWQQGVDRLERGEIDLLFPMFFSEERARRFLLGRESIISTWGRIFARPGSGIDSILDLEGCTVAVVRGDIFNQTLRDLVDRFGLSCTFLETEFPDEAFRSVADKRADAVANERIDGLDHARRSGLTETHVVFNPGNAFFATGPAGAAWQQALDRNLREMKADPGSVYYRAYDRWVGSSLSGGLPIWLRALLVGAGGLILGLGAFALTLRHQVRAKTRQLADRNRLLEQEIHHREGAEQDLRRSLDEKDVLLKEIHHRVKNNLQVISSLLRLQSREIHDEGARRAFQESQERIAAIALVHKELYNSKDFGQVNLGAYLRKLSELLVRGYHETAGRIEVDIRMRDVYLKIDQAIPCGLAVNELVTNAFQHAFPPLFSRQGRIEVELAVENEKIIELSVRDNGIGMPEMPDMRGTESLGLNLVATLVENQLGGSISIEGEGGTTVRIRFPRAEKSEQRDR